MKILLYGMQSSGASALAFALAQKPNSVAFVDIWNNFAAPLLETDTDVVAKVVATTAYSLREHVARFKPDRTIAVLRHPVDNYNSLSNKTYINESGLINEKFREMEAALAAADCFDDIVFHEDFVFSPGTVLDFFDQLGWSVGSEALGFPRTEASIRAFNDATFPWLAGRLRYGLGGFHDRIARGDLVQFAVAAGETEHLPEMCPTLFARYEAARAQRGDLWFVPKTPLLACDLGALMRGLAGLGPLAARTARDGFAMELESFGGTSVLGKREISLGVVGDSPRTRLRISGLPSAPFNRIIACVSQKDPCGVRIEAEFQVTDASGAPLGASLISLSRGAMAYVDVPFKAKAGSVALSISVTGSPETGPSADQALRLEALQLAHGFA